MDPRGPLAIGVSAVHSVAKLRSGLTTDAASAAVQRRGEIVASAAAAGASRFDLVPWAPRTPVYRTMLLVLLGAAGCLLLTVCVNVASLELAVVLQRARTYAIQLSLGASRAQLCRTVLIETAAFTLASTALAAALLRAGTDSLGAWIPERLVSGAVNPIDVDGRAYVFMAAVAAATWVLVSLPLVTYIARDRPPGC